MYLTSYKEVREEVEKTQNPLFLYDNDCDGLCSFTILRRFIGRGEGIAVKSYPDLSSQYLEKIDSMNADSVIVLDIHSISYDFLRGIEHRGLKIIWIDHHQNSKIDEMKESEIVQYFNPLYTINKGKNNNPTSYQALKISGRKKDSWISLVGCIADAYLPSFAEEIGKEYPSMWGKKIKKAFDAYYNTDFGKIALMLNFSLKDLPSIVKETQNFLIKSSSPEELLREDEQNPLFREKTSYIYKKYLELVGDAKKHKEGNSIFFSYSGDVSMSSEISNALMYAYPECYIAVAFKRQGIINISLRGKNVKNILDKILKKIPNSTGGGHQDAVGARIGVKYMDEFKDLFVSEANGFK